MKKILIVLFVLICSAAITVPVNADDVSDKISTLHRVQNIKSSFKTFNKRLADTIKANDSTLSQVRNMFKDIDKDKVDSDEIKEIAKTHNALFKQNEALKKKHEDIGKLLQPKPDLLVE